MSNTTTFYEVTSDADVADQLGIIRSQIKELQTAQKFMEQLLKQKRVTEIDGKLYRVTISYDIETERVNWRKIADKVGYSHQLKAAHTSTSTSDRVNVSALTKAP